MSSPSKKRKISPVPEDSRATNQDATAASLTEESNQQQIDKDAHADSSKPVSDSQSASVEPTAPSSSTPTQPATDRASRFAALKARATDSARSNLKAAQDEASRGAIDQNLLSNLSRRSDIARHNLLKASTEDTDGKGAFERKRAWDYTIEESEKWDDRMAEKKSRRDNNSFADYGAEAGKNYERQVREMERSGKKDGGRARKEYDAAKRNLLERAARQGDLEIVELETGEMVAIDNEGKFYSTTDSTSFVEQKPSKDNIDRLVADLKRAEEQRLKKRAARRGQTDEGDVTYINEKNKQFNLKLGRFYDRYTVGIREAFERGTAL